MRSCKNIVDTQLIRTVQPKSSCVNQLFLSTWTSLKTHTLELLFTSICNNNRQRLEKCLKKMFLIHCPVNRLVTF